MHIHIEHPVSNKAARERKIPAHFDYMQITPSTGQEILTLKILINIIAPDEHIIGWITNFFSGVCQAEKDMSFNSEIVKFFKNGDQLIKTCKTFNFESFACMFGDVDDALDSIQYAINQESKFWSLNSMLRTTDYFLPKYKNKTLIIIDQDFSSIEIFSMALNLVDLFTAIIKLNEKNRSQ